MGVCRLNGWTGIAVGDLGFTGDKTLILNSIKQGPKNLKHSYFFFEYLTYAQADSGRLGDRP